MSSPTQFGWRRAVGGAVAAAAICSLAVAPTAAAGPLGGAHAAAPVLATKIDVDSSNVEELKARSNQTPVVFLITAPAWCGACQQLDPIITAAAANSGGSWILAMIDVDKAKAAAAPFGAKAYPTMIGYSGGREVSNPPRAVGNPGAAGVDSFINTLKSNHTGGPKPGNPNPGNPNPGNPNPGNPNPGNPNPGNPNPGNPNPGNPNPGNPNPGNPNPGNPNPVDPIQPNPVDPNKPDPTEPQPGNPNPGEPNPDNPNPGDGVAPTEPIELTGENFEAFMELSKKVPVVIDFSKEGCDPCAKLAPVLDKKLKADAGKWALGKLDGTAHKELWAKYQNPWFPTLIVVKDGKEVTRRSGYEGDAEAVVKWLDAAMFSDEAPVEDPRVMEVKTMADWKKVYAISKRHPIAINLNTASIGGKDPNGETLAKMANGDGGKWTLANVPLFSAGGVFLAVTEGVFSFPTLLTFYNGRVHLEAHQGEGTEEQLRTWVNKMLSYKYPVE